MASKQPDIINIRRKRASSYSIPLRTTPPGPRRKNGAFSKYGISPTISYPVSGLSPKTSQVNDDFLFYRCKEAKSRPVKNKTLCENQGDVVNKRKSDSSEREQNDQTYIKDAGKVDNKADFLKLPRRALISCSNDWEDEMPIDTLKMCVNLESKSNLSKETDPEDAPQSIDEIFNDILHCFVVNKGASPLRISASMPGCFGPTNSNTNHDVVIPKEDTDDEMDNPSLEEEVAGYSSENVTSTQMQYNIDSSSSNISQQLVGTAIVEVPTKFGSVEYHSDVNIKKPSSEKNNTVPAQIHSAFDRARQLTRKAISTVRSRSPTPHNVREAINNVVQAGKNIVQKSREVIVAATCVLPGSDSEFLVNQESIELEHLSQSFHNEDQNKCVTTSHERKDVKRHDSLANNDPLEGFSMSIADSNTKEVDQSNMGTHLNRENPGQYQLQRVPSDIHDEKVEAVDIVSKKCSLGFIELSGKKCKMTNPNVKAGFYDGKFMSEDLEQRGYQTNNMLQCEKFETEHVYGHKDCKHLIPVIDQLFSCQNSPFQVNESIIECQSSESDKRKLLKTEEHKPLLPITDLKSTGNNEEKVIIFKSSMSDVPFEDVTESEDMPRKTISLVTSNEADQDRDITEVIALISDEVSLKRYKSVNDLTELDKREERSRSLSFSSKERRQCLKLNNCIRDSSNIVVRDDVCNVDNMACKNVDDNGEAEIENRPFLNVLDPSYDTDDDQRSSDLSSCDELSTRSGSQKKTTSSSLTTPPNSPRIGIQAETVGTIVSLFETKSILCASASLDDELGARSSSKTDYHALLDDEVCDLAMNHYEDSAQHLGEYKRNKQIDKIIIQERQLYNNINDSLYYSKGGVNCEKKADVFQKDGNDISKENLDIEQLVASLPSPPSTDSLEGFILNTDATTAHDSSTSKYCENKVPNSNVNLELLRAVLHKENNTLTKNNGVYEHENLSPDKIEFNLGDKITTKKVPFEDNDRRLNSLIEMGVALNAKTKTIICNDSNTTAISRANNIVRWNSESDLLDIAQFDEKMHPSFIVEQDVQSMKISESGGSLSRTCVIELPVLGLKSDNVRVNEEKNVEEVKRHITESYVKRPEITSVIYTRTDSFTDECPPIEDINKIIVDKEPENDREVQLEVQSTTVCNENSESKFLVGIINSDNATNQTTANVMPKDILYEKNIEKNMTKGDDETSKAVQSVKVYCSDNDRVSCTSFKYQTSRNEMHKEEFASANSVKRLETHNNKLSPDGYRSSLDMLIFNEQIFPGDNACSSHSNNPETSHIEYQSEKINPILVDNNMTHRPPRPARIRWALENEILDKPLSACSSRSDRDDADEEEEVNNYIDAFDRCNSCLPKSLDILVHKSKLDTENYAETGINGDFFVANSSKLSKFILHTGALFPSSTLVATSNVYNKSAIEVDNFKRRNKDVNINAQDKCDYQYQTQKFSFEEQRVGHWGDSFPSSQINKNVNSDICITEVDDGAKIAISAEGKFMASNQNKELPLLKLSHTKLHTAKLNKNIKQFKPTQQAFHSHNIQKSHSLDSAIQINEEVTTHYNLSPIMFYEPTPSSLSTHSWPFYKSQSSEIDRPVSGISKITETFETTTSFLDKMSERLESNIAGIHKTYGFIERAQKHLNRCDQLILRSSATLMKSAQLSAKVRDQVNRIDIFLSSGKLASPQRTTCN